MLMFLTHHCEYDERGNVVEPKFHGPFPFEVYFRDNDGYLKLAKPNSPDAGYKRLRHLGNKLCKV